MKRIGILIPKRKIQKSVSEWVGKIKKAGPHKYVKREGTPGNYKYYYRLPDGSLGSKEDLETAARGKKQADQGSKKSPNFYEPEKPKRGQAAAARRKIPGNAPKLGIRISGIDVKGNKVSGEVTSQGADGVTIDRKHHVEYGNVASTVGGNKEKAKTVPKKEWVDPENFNAAEWKKQWDDPKATADESGKEYILGGYGEEGKSIANAIRDTDSRNKRLMDEHQLTHELFRVSGEGESARYTPEREKLHGDIIMKMLSPGKIRTALPSPGEKPKMIMLGGRGGSGKSWFENNLYDPNKYVILDADKIKEEIPEYKGWNANQVHEESSDILEQMLSNCIRLGLNVVLDATMKTADSALAKAFRFKAAGYKTEAHYMHLPKKEAAKRAIGRFKDGGKNGPYSGRYVPVTTVLKNTTNEDSFDQVRKIVDVWSFRDNNVKRGEPPILISEGKKEVEKSYSGLVKFIIKSYI